MLMPLLEAMIGKHLARQTSRNGPGDVEFERMLSNLSILNPIGYALVSHFYHEEKARLIEKGQRSFSMRG